jgi:hypothetical protein
MRSLLPPNATALERNIERTQLRFNPPRIIPTLWNPRTCPVNMLPYLAFAYSVEDWDYQWSESQKRTAIEEARYIHQHKGTPEAIMAALAVRGQGDADLIERADYLRCDGSDLADGKKTCGGEWATFRVVLKNPVTIGEANMIRHMMENNKRNCIHLQSIEFSAAAFRCDGAITCDGSFTCGTVDTTIN